MVASQLFALTGKVKYAELAQLILYNGVYHAQRGNGGFGCDTCATDGVLTAHCYEAYWCCTMRGGEGLAAAAAYSVTEDGVIINPVSVDTKVNGKSLKITSGYPFSDTVKIRYEGGGKLRLFVPSFTVGVKCEYISGIDENYVYIDAPDAEFTLKIKCKTWRDGTRVFDGPLMLACEEKIKLNGADDVKKENGEYSAAGKKLSVLCNTYLQSEAETLSKEYWVELI
jgi:DUF1680 family protein